MLNIKDNLTEGLKINKRKYNKRTLAKKQYIFYTIGILFLLIIIIVLFNLIKNMFHISELKKRNYELQKKITDNKYDMEDILNSLSLRDLKKIELEKKKIDKETEISWKQKELEELKSQNFEMKKT